jgi:PAS domain S-box-containing protein
MQRFLSIFQRLKIQTKLVFYYTTFVVITTGIMILVAYHQTAQFLQATTDQATALGVARQVAISIGVIGLPISMLLIVAAGIMAQRIMAPLRALSETVSRIAGGELDASAPILSKDEVGSLAQAFNSMTEKLRQTLAGMQDELHERKRAEENLLQFRNVMDESSDAIFLIDLENGHYLDFNKSAYELLGYNREELAQLAVMDVAQHLPDLKIWLARVDLIRKSGSLIFETDYRRKDQSIFPVEVSARLLTYVGKSIMVAVVRDIAERKRAEEALVASEVKFRMLAENTPIVVYQCKNDTRFTFLYLNDAIEGLTGYSKKAFLEDGLSFFDLYHPDDVSGIVVPEDELSYHKRSFHITYRIRHASGEWRWVDEWGAYVTNELNQVEYIVGMMNDITERKQAEEALRESEARVRALLRAFPDMILELSLDGSVINMVPLKGMEKAMPSERFIGKQIDDVFDEATASQTKFAIQRASESGQINIFEFDLEMGGTLRTMEARVTASAADTVLMMIRDVSQRKWIEQEREKLIQELELKNVESETLRRSLSSIVGTLEFTEIIDRVLEEIRQVIPYDTASVWRVEGRSQYIISGVDLPPEIEIPGTVFVVNETNSAFPLLMGRIPYVLNNNVQAELSDFQQPPHTYVQSWLAIPMKTRGRIIGMINLDGRSRSQFTEHHAELAVTFANQLAIALDNVRLFSELQTDLEERRKLIAELELKNAESETLRESVAIVAATLEKSEAVDRILEQLERVVPFDSASVQLIHGNMLEMVSARGFSLSPDPVENRFALGEPEPAYPAVKGRVPYILYEDIQLHVPAFREFPHNRIHAWMAVPLRVKGQILGIIALDGYQSGQFSERHAHLAVAYANQVAIALENARLFSDLQSELSARKILISELENKNAELERFTYTVSHDLKSPLFTIRGFLGYLEQDALAGNVTRLKSDIQRITEATEKMQRLLNELLELSRVGRLRNESTCFPFSDLAQEASELVQGRIMARGIRISMEPNLPMVYGDRPRLTEVLQNLLDNAAKFMGDQKEPCIGIGCEGEEEGKPILYVRDNGMGIAPEHFDRVFGLFNKLDPKTDGTGIGLALVKRIIEVHGGRIWVESAAGKGSTFFFTLPPAVPTTAVA